jgi:hypothetical protein
MAKKKAKGSIMKAGEIKRRPTRIKWHADIGNRRICNGTNQGKVHRSLGAV